MLKGIGYVFYLDSVNIADSHTPESTFCLLPITYYLLPHLYALGGEGVAVVFDEKMAVL